jgi:hypothetical protein
MFISNANAPEGFIFFNKPQRRRRDIFVELPNETNSAPLGAAYSDFAPTELKIFFEIFYKYDAPTVLNL